ncbi:MAG: BamA/TamA family outer membrane protein, partial [Acidobacteriaceae bacterium]|nr:BamA/TamA family outer membrane protein [Acidobacteriaceae bacterium]
AWLGAASLVCADLPDSASGSGETDLNVNSRYTVESVEIAPHNDYKLSGQILEEIHHLVGEHLNAENLNRLSKKITEELRARSVTVNVHRGASPSNVRVTFEVDRRETDFDVSLSNISYNSREGWSGTGQASLTLRDNAFTVAGLSNGDDQVERYSGIRLRYDRLRVGTNRVRLGFEYDSFRDQYDSRISSLGAGTLRSQTNFEPSATLVLARPLTVTAGFSFQNLQPDNAALKAQSANALVNTVRYVRQWETSGATSLDLDAVYRLRAATGFLGTASPYTKHLVSSRYNFKRYQHSVEVTLMAGWIYGQAPLFERFVLGNNSTLRGWDKYELDPLGGNRMAYASVTYGYHIMKVFYDTGSVWNRGNTAEEKHSVGIGLTTGLGIFSKNALLVAVAFPIKTGHVQPMIVAGMNF